MNKVLEKDHRYGVYLPRTKTFVSLKNFSSNCFYLVCILISFSENRDSEYIYIYIATEICKRCTL